MPLPLIVSISRHVRGLETLSHFLHSRTALCFGCYHVTETLAPVSLLDGGEVDPDEEAAAYLCEPCSLALPTLGVFIRSEWPSTITALEIERVWSLVRHEQKRELAAKVARQGAVPSTIEDVGKALTAALEKAGADKAANRIGKVA